MVASSRFNEKTFISVVFICFSKPLDCYNKKGYQNSSTKKDISSAILNATHRCFYEWINCELISICDFIYSNYPIGLRNTFCFQF